MALQAPQLVAVLVQVHMQAPRLVAVRVQVHMQVKETMMQTVWALCMTMMM